MKFDNITLRDVICRPSEIDSEQRELERLKSSPSSNTYIFGGGGGH